MSVNRYNSATGKLERIAGATLYADAPIGAIQAYGGTTAPSGWLLCQGQAVNRTEYAELFKAIGTTFGTGDGSTTFNVPDLRESVPVGIGENGTATITEHDTYTLGEFKDDQLQGHGHTFKQEGGNPPSSVPINSRIVFGGSQTGAKYNTAAIGNTSIIDARTGTTTHGKQLGVNYIIKAKQVSTPFDIAEYVRKWNELEPIPSVRIGGFTGWTQGDLTQNRTMEHDGIVNVFLDHDADYYTITDLNGSETNINTPSVHSTASSNMTFFLNKGYKIRLSTNTYSGLSIQYYLNRD